MELLIVRHGIAEELQPGQSDFDRALTGKGIERTGAACRGLAKVVSQPDVILTSPKVRAVQTAAILGDVFERKPQVLDVLADDPPIRVWQALRKYRHPMIAIVGHEPNLSMLIERLLFTQEVGSIIELKKAGAAFLWITNPAQPVPNAHLHWLLPPAMLRKLARL